MENIEKNSSIKIVLHKIHKNKWYEKPLYSTEIYHQLTFLLTLFHVRVLHSTVVCETYPDNCHKSVELRVIHALNLHAKETDSQADE